MISVATLASTISSRIAKSGRFLKPNRLAHMGSNGKDQEYGADEGATLLKLAIASLINSEVCGTTPHTDENISRLARHGTFDTTRDFDSARLPGIVSSFSEYTFVQDVPGRFSCNLHGVVSNGHDANGLNRSVIQLCTGPDRV